MAKNIKKLEDFYKANGRYALLVDGARQIDMNFGAIYENVVTQELVAHGFRPNYYTSRIHREVDFVVEYEGRVLPIEVKCGKSYARHRALNSIMESDEYGIAEAIVFDRDALKVEGKVFYAPIYMMMFLKKDTMPDSMIYDMSK